MKKFWTPKKFWVIFLALIGTGLFIFSASWRIWFSKPEIPQGIKKPEGPSAAIARSVSSVYRYDFKKREYLSDEGESWQGSDFTRYIYDLAPEGKELDKCYYFLYDNLKKEMTGGGQRKCNSNLTITVGENKNCSSQGENICTLYVYAVDKSGNQGEMAAVTYHVDWEGPKIEKIFTKENEEYPIKIGKGEAKNYKAKASDNTELGYCWLYIDGKNVGAMKTEDGLASLDYTIREGELHNGYVRCADHYDTEKAGYLNINSGELTEIVIVQNHPPKISSCRVSPTQGGTETEFQFQVEAVDPDGDTLSYKWVLGDGKDSNEKNPVHQYLSAGTYQPKIIVADGRGGEDNCSTAWVVVSGE